MTRAWLQPNLHRLWIRKKNLEVVRLGPSLTPPQKHLVTAVEEQMSAGRPVRFIILKARQMGVSTLIEAIGFTASFTLRGMRGIVVAHDNPSAEHLLSMTHFYWSTWPFKQLFTPTSEARNRLSWRETESMLQIATAKNVETGRSRTLHFVHNSEAAFYPNPDLMSALNQAIPREPFTFHFIESTANGVGNWFYRFWNAAREGEVDYIPMFYPWWRHPTYTAEGIGQSYRLLRPLTNLDSEERVLLRALRKIGLTDEEIKSRLIWRRAVLNTECQGDLLVFHQEYPSTDEEAFVSTGSNVFDLDKLKAVYEPEDGERGNLVRESGIVRFVPSHTGPLRIYRRPRKDGVYMVGGDASKAAVKGDYAVAQVIDRRTYEQVATFRQRMVPELFAQELMKLGDFYNHAMLAPENNMSGGAVAAILRTSYYDNVFMHRKANRVPGQIDRMYGWLTNMQTKAEAVGALQALLHETYMGIRGEGIDTGFRIHDEATFQEMKGYIVNSQGGFEASGAEHAEHDDTVMALAIAVVCTKYEAHNLERIDEYNTAARRSLLHEAFDEVGMPYADIRDEM